MSVVDNQSAFVLGSPQLICRWRLIARQLPMAQRHLKALRRRKIKAKPLSPELVAWVAQRVEWGLDQGAQEYPDGVLMLMVDEQGYGALSIGAYQPLASTDSIHLLKRAIQAAKEAEATELAPEVACLVCADELRFALPEQCDGGATFSLLKQLAQTMGIAQSFDPELLANLSGPGAKEQLKSLGAEALLLCSDEHGIVTASDFVCPRAEKLAQCYDVLVEKTRKAARGRGIQ